MELSADVVEELFSLLISDDVLHIFYNFIYKVEGGSDVVDDPLATTVNDEIRKQLFDDFLISCNCAELKSNGFVRSAVGHGYFVTETEEKDNIITIVVDHSNEVIYIIDPLDHQISFYRNLYAAITRGLGFYERRCIPLFRSDRARLILTQNPDFLKNIIAIFVWAINMRNQNQQLWYLFLKEISSLPQVNDQTACEFLKYFQAIQPELFLKADPDLEKTKVKEIVQRMVKTYAKFSHVKSTVSLRYQKKIGNAELIVITRKYVKCCRKLFFEELAEFMGRNKIADRIKENFQSFIQWLDEQDDVAEILSTMKVYPLLFECKQLMTKDGFTEFLIETKRQCLQQICKNIKFLSSESTFLTKIQKLLPILFRDYCAEDCSERKQAADFLNECKQAISEGRIESFLQKIVDSRNEELVSFKLKSEAKSLLDNAGKHLNMLPSVLKKMFNKFDETLQITFPSDKNGNLLSCRGAYVSLKNLTKTRNISTEVCCSVTIVASETICIDADIVIPGNIVLVSPQIYVIGLRKFDLSGRHGKNIYQSSATNGTAKGEDGFAGKVGEHGSDGGNVFIYGKVVVDSENLEIFSNGGDGGTGQDGGYGADGEDGPKGEEMTREELDEMFPKYTTAGRLMKDLFIDTVMPYVAIVRDVIAGGKYRVLKHGKKEIIEYTYDAPGFAMANIAVFGYPRYQAYCICNGSPGMPGKHGGAGGKGGEGGHAGKSGEIDIRIAGNSIRTCNENGNIGSRGKNGKGGLGGFHGQRGLDIGRIEPSQYRSVREYGPARLLLYYVSKKESDTSSAYCSHKTKEVGSARYAKIRKISSEGLSRTFKQTTRKNINQEKKERSKTSERHNFRSIPISKSSVMKEYSAFSKREIFDDQKIELHQIRKKIDRYGKQAAVTRKQFVKIKTYSDFEITYQNHRQDRMHKIKTFVKQCVTQDNAKNVDIKPMETALVSESEFKVIIKMMGSYPIDNFDELCLLHADISAIDSASSDSLAINEFHEERKQLLEMIAEKIRFSWLQNLSVEMHHLEKEICNENENDSEIFFIKQRLFIINDEMMEDIFMAEQPPIKRCVRTYIEKARRDVCWIRENVGLGQMYSDSSEEIEKIDSDSSDIDIGDAGDKINMHDNQLNTSQAEFNNDIVNSLKFHEQKGAEDPKEQGVEQTQFIEAMQLQRAEERMEIIACFQENLRERPDINVPPVVKEAIALFQFIDVPEMGFLIDIFTSRILTDGVHISEQLLLWFCNEILKQTDSKRTTMLSLIIASNPMTNWLPEYVLLWMVDSGIVNFKDEHSFRKVFNGISDQRWFPDIIMLSDNTKDSSSVNKILNLLQHIPYDVSLLQGFSKHSQQELVQRLKEADFYQSLSGLPVRWSDSGFIEAEAYFYELEMVHGKDVVDELFRLIKQSQKEDSTNVDQNIIIKVLKQFCFDHWHPSSAMFKKMNGIPIDRWLIDLNVNSSSVSERSLSCLVEMIESDSNNSYSLHRVRQAEIYENEDRETKMKNLQVVLEAFKDPEKLVNIFDEDFLRKWKSDFEGQIRNVNEEKMQDYLDQVRSWSANIRERLTSFEAKGKKSFFPKNKSEIFTTEVSNKDSKEWPPGVREEFSEYERSRKNEFLMENISEVFACVEIGLSLINGFKLRDVQRLSILLMLFNIDRGLLQQISTGEGKTLIIVAFCIIKGMLGHTIDVVTSSSLLAERDATENIEIYNLFSVKVSHNCNESEEKRADAYKNEVVYGEVGSFQNDALLQQFYGKTILARRTTDLLVVDEVDNMLLDKASNVLYLSHDIADLAALEPVFVYIWSFAHSKDLRGTSEDISAVKEGILSVLYGIVRKKDLKERLKLEDEVIDLIWSHLIEVKIISEEGKILRKHELLANKQELRFQYDIQKKLSNAEVDLEGMVLCFFKEMLRKGNEIDVPNYLNGFINLHLSDWIRNAFKARYMQERCHYVIDVNRTEYDDGESANIVIMDTDTGKEQYNTQWSEGLHQFLQLKHGRKCSVESLKAVFTSNVQFFKSYKKSIYGLTGTLGSKEERDLLRSMYDVNYINIPTFCEKRFNYKENYVFTSEDAWLCETSKIALKTAEERPVLVICETIKDLEKFEKWFQNCSSSTNINVHVYKHSYQIFDIVEKKQELGDGCIILATNLAGRGTDIKISKDIDQKGGLHVILTFLPKNLRVQEQAFGRAARKGQRGSGQLSVLGGDLYDEQINDSIKMLQMLRNRNADEAIRIEGIKNHYDNIIEKEEEYFQKFKTVYSHIKQQFNNIDAEKRNILLEACTDRWAFWLDEFGILLKEGKDKEILDHHWKLFESDMRNRFEGDDTLQMVTTVSKRISLAKYFMKKKKYRDSMNVLEKVVCDEPLFAEDAHYYMVYSIVNETRLSKPEEQEKAKLHLYSAEQIIKSKIEMYTNMNNMVAVIKKMYGGVSEGFTTGSTYEKQKENLIDLLNIFQSSIDDILGPPIHLTMLDNIFEGDKVLSKKIFESDSLFERPQLLDFENDSELKNATEKFRTSQSEKLRERYSLYWSDMDHSLKKKKMDLNPLHFENILPSREEFWSLLKEKNLLSDLNQYVIVDAEEIRKIPQLKDFLESNEKDLLKLSSKTEFESLHQCPTFCTDQERSSGNELSGDFDENEACCVSNEIQICMYPEHIDSIVSGRCIAININDKTAIDKIYWELLDVYKVTSTNETAQINIFKLKATSLSKYDGLSKEDLMTIPNMDNDVATKIFGALELPPPHIMPVISAFELKGNKQFQDDVTNIILKHYQYRECRLTIARNHMVPLEKLEIKTHEKLWQDLLDFRIISPAQVKKNVSEEDVEIILKKVDGSLSESFNRICYFFGTKSISKQSSTISDLQSQMIKFETVEATLKELDEIVDEKTKREAIQELSLFTTKGQDHVIIFQEQKWSWKTIIKIAGIIALGIAKISLGLIITVFTAGAGTLVAQALIGDGIDDLMFAAESIISGHCSMKEYVKQKVIGLTLSVLTGGVGRIFSRGAKFSRFGHKIANEVKFAGRQFGKRQTLKEASKRVGKKLIGGGIGLATAGLDKMVEKMLDEELSKLSRKIVDNIKPLNYLSEALQKLCQKFGFEKAKAIALNKCEKHLELQFEEIFSGLDKILDTINSGLKYALGELKKTNVGGAKVGMLTAITQILSISLKYAPYIDAVKNMCAFCLQFKFELPSIIEMEASAEIQDSDDHTDVTDKDVHEIQKELEDKLTEKLKSTVEDHLIKPALQHQATKLLHYAANRVKSSYRNLETKCQDSKFRSLQKLCEEKETQIEHQADTPDEKILEQKDRIRREHTVELVKLQKRVKNPELYARLLEQGLPMSINEAQALSNCINRPIKIIHTGDGGRIKEDFLPDAHHSTGEVVVIYFTPSVDGGIGHFSADDPRKADSHPNQTDSGGNNCLLDALTESTGFKIDRRKVTNLVREDPRIRERIGRGVHRHYIETGATGGLLQGKEKRANLEKFINEMKEKYEDKIKEGKPFKLDDRDKRMFRDTAKASYEGWRPTGNHECIQIKDISQLLIKDHQNEMNRAFKPDGFGEWMECHTYARVDTCYGLVVTDAGTVNCHPGGLFSDEQRTRRSQMTKGSASQLHSHSSEILAASTAQEGTRIAFEFYLKALKPRDEVQSAIEKSKTPVLTATGHDLHDPEQRDKFLDGYEREQWKIAQIVQRLGGEECKIKLENTTKNEEYINTITRKLNSAKNVRDYGMISQEPAPIDSATATTRPAKRARQQVGADPN